MKKLATFLLSFALCYLVVVGAGFCRAVPQPGALASTYSAEVAVKWADLTLAVILDSPFNSPTYSSRTLGYMGVAMYESVVHSNPKYRSLVGQLSGLANLPQPEKGRIYNWPMVMNAGQALLLYRLYPHASRNTHARIDSLQTAIAATCAVNEKSDVTERSVQYGWALANALFDWSKADGGHEGFSRNFNSAYPLPVGEGYWIAPTKGQSSARLPLHVTWGNNRPFVPANQKLPVPTALPYSTDPVSAYYKEFDAVRRKNGTLTREEKNIAIWWADDPAFTASPPGHSFNLATTAIRMTKPDLVKAAQTYARVGMSVADAFINCWKCKYTYHRERPSTFIAANIDKSWKPFWPEPPFPAFSSGHSTQAAAAATVLADLYGNRFAFTDSTHYGRPLAGGADLDSKPRSFKSFWESAVECADSRFYGGIHTNVDNEIGLVEGKKIGRNVNALAWKK